MRITREEVKKRILEAIEEMEDPEELIAALVYIAGGQARVRSSSGLIDWNPLSFPADIPNVAIGDFKPKTVYLPNNITYYGIIPVVPSGHTLVAEWIEVARDVTIKAFRDTTRKTPIGMLIGQRVIVTQPEIGNLELRRFAGVYHLTGYSIDNTRERLEDFASRDDVRIIRFEVNLDKAREQFPCYVDDPSEEILNGKSDIYDQWNGDKK